MDQTKYIKGFNHGYVLANEDPSLLKSILDQNKMAQGDYLSGLERGLNQYQLEKGAIQKEKTSKEKLNDIYKGKGREVFQARSLDISEAKQRNKDKER